MLRFLGKTTASTARSGGSSAAEAVEEGLSTWELVNAPLSDDDDVVDLYSYDSDDVVSDCDGVICDEPEPNPVQEEDDDADGDDDIISVQTLSISPPMTFPVEMTLNYVRHDYAEEYHEDDDGGVHDVHDEEDDVDDDDYDVDDELVPWKLKDRFGKQRIRKIGKKSGPKFNKSKRVPYYDNRPGFSYGKFRGCC